MVEGADGKWVAAEAVGALLEAEEPDENVLAWAPSHDGGNPDPDEAAGEMLDYGCVATVHEVCADVGYTETEEVDCSRGDEVVPDGVSLVGWHGGSFGNVP